MGPSGGRKMVFFGKVAHKCAWVSHELTTPCVCVLLLCLKLVRELMESLDVVKSGFLLVQFVFTGIVSVLLFVFFKYLANTISNPRFPYLHVLVFVTDLRLALQTTFAVFSPMPAISICLPREESILDDRQ